jgi:hypothetical protein
VAVDGNLRPDLRTLDADRTSGTATTAIDGRLGAAPRTMVVKVELVAVDGSPVSEPRTPAAERSSGEELVVVDGNLRSDLRTLDADPTSGTATTANDG